MPGPDSLLEKCLGCLPYLVRFRKTQGNITHWRRVDCVDEQLERRHKTWIAMVTVLSVPCFIHVGYCSTLIARRVPPATGRSFVHIPPKPALSPALSSHTHDELLYCCVLMLPARTVQDTRPPSHVLPKSSDKSEARRLIFSIHDSAV